MQTFEWSQRKYDGKWVLWKYMVDPNENLEDWYEMGMEMHIPKVWIPIKVVDYLVEVKNG